MAARVLGASPDEVFNALGNPARLTLARTLMEGERWVFDLVNAVGLGWSTTSKHLDILREAGVVSSDNRGQKIFYRLELECMSHFIECLSKARHGRPSKRTTCDCA